MDQWTVSSLMSLLPRGLAVGPSLSCGGALGLWWVGLPLEAGSELPTGRGLHQDSTNHTVEKTNDKSTILPLFLHFACQAQSSSQQNLSVQTQGQTVQATQTIQTGAELLLGPTREPDPVTGEHSETGHVTVTYQELSPETEETQTASADINICALLEEERTSAEVVDAEGMKTAEKYVKRKTRPNKTDSSQPVPSKMFNQEKNVGLKMAATAHKRSEDIEPESLWSRVTPPVRKPAPRKQSKLDQASDGKAERRRGVVAVETTGDAVTVEVAGEGQVKVRETPGDGVAVETRGGRERRHTCETCGKSFFQKSHLDKHKFTHSSTKEFTCDQCEKTYSSKDSFKAHQLFHQRKRPFPCPMCPKAYGLKRDLKEHLVLHSGLRPYKCSDCGRGFTRRPSLRVHQLIHCVKGERAAPSPRLQVQCSVCSKFLSSSGSLKNHMKIHTGERKHMCADCGKSFSQKGNLAAHVRTHSGEQPFTCTVCGRSFSQWHELQRHQQVHSGTRFLCSICGKALKDSNTLRAHEALHSEERTHPCPHCPKGYISASKLRVHLLSAHSTEKPFSCHCGAAYALRQSLTRHQALHRVCQSGAGPQQHPPPIIGRPRGETRKSSPEEIKSEEHGEERGNLEEHKEEGVKTEDHEEEGVNPEEHGEEGINPEEIAVLIVQEVEDTVEIDVEIN